LTSVKQSFTFFINASGRGKTLDKARIISGFKGEKVDQ